MRSMLKPVLSITMAASLALSGLGMYAASATEAYGLTAAEAQAEAQSTYYELLSYQTLLEEKSAEYYNALYEYQGAVEKRDEVKKEIDETEKRIGEIQDRLGDRAASMYREGQASFLDVLLEATSFDDFVQRWDMLNMMNQNDADLEAEAKSLKDKLEDKHAEYQIQTELLDKKSAEAAEAYEQSQKLVEETQALYDSLSEEARVLYEQEQAAAAAAAAAQAEAEAAAAQEASYEYYDAETNEPITSGGYVNDDGSVTDIATGQTYSSASDYSASTGNAIVDRARAMIGSDYVWGGVGGSDGGFDCSGLVSYAVTGENTRLGTTHTFMGYNQVSDPQPGDICVNEGHTGIYVGDGQMIHAADYGIGVIEGPVQSGMIYVRP